MILRAAILYPSYLFRAYSGGPDERERCGCGASVRGSPIGRRSDDACAALKPRRQECLCYWESLLGLRPPVRLRRRTLQGFVGRATAEEAAIPLYWTRGGSRQQRKLRVLLVEEDVASHDATRNGRHNQNRGAHFGVPTAAKRLAGRAIGCLPFRQIAGSDFLDVHLARDMNLDGSKSLWHAAQIAVH